MPPSVVADRFELRVPLARGALGQVYEAFDTATRTDIAVKLIHPELTADEATREALVATALATRNLGRSDVLGAIAAGVDPQSGVTWVATERLRGMTLRERMRHTPRLGARDAAVAIDAIAAPLAAMHERGLVHGDLKPENVFYERTARGPERLVILDACLGLRVRESQRPSPYLAPEQANDSRWITPAADVWALGVIFYEMLAGQPPWPRTGIPDENLTLAREPHVPILRVLPFLSSELSAFLDRCLAKNPGDRPRDASVFIAEVRRLFSPPQAPRVVPQQLGGRVVSLAGAYKPHAEGAAKKKSRAWVWAVVALGLALFCVLPCGLSWSAVRSMRNAYGEELAQQNAEPEQVYADEPQPSPSQGESGGPGVPSPTPLPTPNATPPRLLVPPSGPRLGPDDALVTIVVFGAFGTPECWPFWDNLDRVRMRNERDVAIVWKDLPSFDEPGPLLAAEAGRQAFDEGGTGAFWRMHARLCSTPGGLDRREIELATKDLGLDVRAMRNALRTHFFAPRVAEALLDARRFGLGDPPAVVVNGVRAPDHATYEQIFELVDRELTDAERLVASGVPRDEIYDRIVRGDRTSAPPLVRHGTPF